MSAAEASADRREREQVACNPLIGAEKCPIYMCGEKAHGVGQIFQHRNRQIRVTCDDLLQAPPVHPH